MSLLTPREPAAPRPYREVAGWEAIRAGFAAYLADESRLQAENVARLHFPNGVDEVAAAVRAVAGRGHRLTISAGRTGIAGAAVPIEAEEILSLEDLSGRPVVDRDADGTWFARVGASVTLAGLADALDHGLCSYPSGRPPEPLYYPIDATEISAHIGGTIATNASGARTLAHGPTRDWVRALTVVLADGRVLELRRGEVRADGAFTLSARDGSTTTVPLIDLTQPATKHNAGYLLRRDMDAIDLFIGSEGTLGVVVAAEVRLTVKPANRLFLTQFLADSTAALRYVAAVKRHPDLPALALEYFGPRALELMRARGEATTAYVELARLPAGVGAAVYTELPFADEAELDRQYAALRAVCAEADIDPAFSWAGFARQDSVEMKRLRHALPETVNTLIGERKRSFAALHKVGTDMAVPDAALGEMMEIYESRLEAAGLEFVIFGHVGDGHLHVNILPRNPEELDRAKTIYTDFAREAVRLGGSVAAEHGIGRLKKPFMAVQYSDAELAAMQAVKRALDPGLLLNPGVLF